MTESDIAAALEAARRTIVEAKHDVRALTSRERDALTVARALVALAQEQAAARDAVIEECAAVADRHVEEAKASAQHYKAQPDDDGSYSQCLADRLKSMEIAIAIRALRTAAPGKTEPGT